MAGSIPLPSSRTSITTLPPAWRAAISIVPWRGLPAATRSSGSSRPWSRELRTRWTSGSPSASTTVRSSSVSRADQLELDLLAELGRQVADQPREAQEDHVDRDHPDLHDHRLEGLRAAGQFLHGVLEALDLEVRGQCLDRGAVDHELAHRVHQRVEAFGVDAHRARRLGLRLGRLLGGRCGLGRRLRRDLDRRLWGDLDGRLRNDLGRGNFLLGLGDVGDGDRGDLGDAGQVLDDRLVLMIGGHPGADLAALELLESLGGGNAAQHLAVIGECGEHHVRPDRRHHHVLGERHADEQDAGPGRAGGLHGRAAGLVDAAVACHLLLGGARSHEAAQPARRAVPGRALPARRPRSTRPRPTARPGTRTPCRLPLRAAHWCAGAAARRRPPCDGSARRCSRSP